MWLPVIVRTIPAYVGKNTVTAAESRVGGVYLFAPMARISHGLTDSSTRGLVGSWVHGFMGSWEGGHGGHGGRWGGWDRQASWGGDCRSGFGRVGWDLPAGLCGVCVWLVGFGLGCAMGVGVDVDVGGWMRVCLFSHPVSLSVPDWQLAPEESPREPETGGGEMGKSRWQLGAESGEPGTVKSMQMDLAGPEPDGAGLPRGSKVASHHMHVIGTAAHRSGG